MRPDENVAYAVIVKRFHLGAEHVFHSWDRLSDEERARWAGVFAEVRHALTQAPPVH